MVIIKSNKNKSRLLLTSTTFKTMNIKLRKTTSEDLEFLFEFQTDEKGGYLAAFMPADPNNREAYFIKWTKIIENPDINMQTILINDKVIGSVARFFMEGDAEVSYWIDRQYWGKGIGTHAVEKFLETEYTRPLFGRVAFDNYGSQRVLEKNGFVKIKTAVGFANARNKEIEEFIYHLG